MSAYLGAYGISHRFRGSTNLALDEVSFELEKGEILALIGPNGSGKSTLLKLLSGVLKIQPGCGIVKLQGSDILSLGSSARARAMAYLGNDLRAEFPMTAGELVSLARGCHHPGLANGLDSQDRDRVREAMDLCLCWDLRDRDLSELSGGERQLVLLARGIAQESKVLLLDETFSRMDLHHQAVLGERLKRLTLEKGLAVAWVAHDLNLACRWSSRCILLNRGKRAAEGPLSSTLTERNLKLLYPDAPILVGRSPGGSPRVEFRSTSSD